MRSFENLAKQVHDAAYGDLTTGSRNAEGVLKNAIAALPDLVSRGEFTHGDIAQLEGLLSMPGPPPLDVREYLSEFNLAGAQALSELATIRQVALTRCGILLEIAKQIGPKSRTRALRRVTQIALDLAKQWHLEELDPYLVGDLYLQAGNVNMANVGPLTSDVDRGLEKFLSGYCLKKDGGDPAELARLADLMRRAAGFLLQQASVAEAFNVDFSRTHDKLETAVDVFEAVGPETSTVEARLLLLSFYLAHRFLDAAEPFIDGLAAQAVKLSPKSIYEFSLYRADWLSQRYRAEDALSILEPLFSEGTITGRDWPYAQTIRANCYRLLNRFDDAHAAFSDLLMRAEADRAAEPNAVHPRERVFLALAHLGYLDIRTGRVAEGQQRFERAAELGKAQVVTWESQVRHVDLWASALYEAGIEETALDKYEHALALRQRIEAEVQHLTLREGFQGSWALIDSRIAELCLRLHKPDRALEVIEGSKSRALQALADRHSPLGVSGVGSVSHIANLGESSPEGALRRDYALLATERERLRRELGIVVDAATRHSMGRQLHSVEQQMAGVRELMERRLAKRAFGSMTPTSSAPSYSAKQVLEILPSVTPDGARWGIVSFHSGHDGTAVLLAADGEPQLIRGRFQRNWPYERVRREIYDPWEAARQAHFSRQASAQAWEDALEQYRRQLYEALWASIVPELDKLAIRHLLVLPHRLLHLVPHAAAKDEASGGDLLDLVETVCIAPGAGFLRAAAKRFSAEGASGRRVIFANPDENAALITLEAARVAKQFRNDSGGGAVLYPGTASHPQALYEVSAEASVLHLACHAVWDADDLTRSGLRMAPLPADVPRLFGQANGLVNLSALLAQLSLPKCDLAVLSACESGLAKRSSADEPLSLPLAFLLGGARRVIASLWRVRDDSTLLLMAEFYRCYLGGATASASLANAQRWLRRLSREDAIEILTAFRAELADLPSHAFDEAILERAEVQLNRRLAELRDLLSTNSPYASPDHWAAFVCFGLPQAPASNTTNKSETEAGGA